MPRHFLLFIFFLLSGVLQPESALADRNSRALKALEEGDFPEVLEQLSKSIEKDTLNPGAYYIYALLYTTKSYSDYDVDRAHIFILKSLNQFDLTNEDLVKDMNRLEVSSDSLSSLKNRIDNLAFKEAAEKDDIPAYENFMESYPDASQFDDALVRRNELAFENAEEINTWQGYKTFMETYPEARQVSEANALYQRLLFEDQTEGNTLAAFQNFLKKYPNTPYRDRTELAILEVLTASNKASEYLNFLAQFPDSKWSKRVIDILYYLPKNKADQDVFDRWLDKLSIADSIKSVEMAAQDPLITIFDDGAYGFMNHKGQMIIEPAYTGVTEDYLCGDIRADFLEVKVDQVTRVIARNDHLIFEGAVQSVEDIGIGLLAIEDANRTRILHKSGFEIDLGQIEGARILDNSFIIYEKDERLGIATFLGKPLLMPAFDEADVLGPYYVFRKDDRVAVKLKDQLLDAADQQFLALDFKFEEVELMREQYLFAAIGEEEAVYDDLLNPIIPLADHRIYPMKDGWLIKQPFGYRIQHDEERTAEAQLYDQVLYNDRWVAVKEENSWQLVSKSGIPRPVASLDSVYLISNDMAFILEAGEEKILFSSGKKITVSKGDQYALIGPRKISESADKNYLLLKNSKICRLYKPGGKEIFKARMDDMKYLVPGFFEIKLNGLSGIIDTEGNIPIWPKYEAIASISDSLIMVLDNGNFDVFHLYKEKLIARYFDRRIEPYNTQYLVVSKNGRQGLIDNDEGEQILDIEYKNIEYWTDSTALVEQDDQYKIIDIRSEQTLFSGIKEFTIVRQSRESSIIKYLGDDGFGIYSSLYGVVLRPEYNDIVNLGTEKDPLYFAEQHLPKAAFYVVTYADAQGNVVRSQAFRPDAYEKIYCDL